MNRTPTKKDAIAALKALRDIKMPDGNHEGEAINSPAVYAQLSSEEQEIVDNAECIVTEYTRNDGGCEPNTRSVTELLKAGFPTTLSPDQDDPNRIVGKVEVDELTLDISDQTGPSNE